MTIQDGKMKGQMVTTPRGDRVVITEDGTAVDNVKIFNGGGLQVVRFEFPVIYVDTHLKPQRGDSLTDIDLRECKALDYLEPEDVAGIVEDWHERQMQREQERRRVAAERRAAEDASRVEYEKQKPAWAKAAIVAHLLEDECDCHTDYFGSRTIRRIIIGWSRSERNNLGELAQHAKNCGLVAGIEWKEHRENYSGGRGYFLSDAASTSYGGWQIRKAPCSESQGRACYEYCLPEPTSPERAEREQVSDVTVRPGTRAGFVEIVFPEKPDAVVLSELKSNGFRWSRRNGVWYGKDYKIPPCIKAVMEAA